MQIVLFDLWDTVARKPYSIVQRLIDYFSLPHTHATLRPYYEAVTQTHDWPTDEGMAKGLLDALGLPARRDHIAFVLRTITEAGAGARFVEGQEELLRDLSSCCSGCFSSSSSSPSSSTGSSFSASSSTTSAPFGGCRLALVSNTTQLECMQADARLHFLKLFSHHFLSYTTGLVKPHPALFERIVQDLGAPASSFFFVDDTQANLVAAKQLGMQTHHFISSSALRAELTRRGILCTS